MRTNHSVELHRSNVLVAVLKRFKHIVMLRHTPKDILQREVLRMSTCKWLCNSTCKFFHIRYTPAKMSILLIYMSHSSSRKRGRPPKSFGIPTFANKFNATCQGDVIEDSNE